MIDKVGLIRPPGRCLAQARHLAELGVDEVACLIDFGAEYEYVMASLEHVALIAEEMKTTAVGMRPMAEEHDDSR